MLKKSKRPMSWLLSVFLIVQLLIGNTYAENMTNNVEENKTERASEIVTTGSATVIEIEKEKEEVISLKESGPYTLKADDVLLTYFDEGIGIAYFRGDISVTGTDIIIPSTIDGMDIKVIGEKAFYGRGARFTSIEILKGVTRIGDHAFDNNDLASVKMPNSVTSIGESAFANNKLTNVDIPNSVTSIGNSAFIDNELTSIEIPDGVISIDDGAFYSNKLTSVKISGSVTSIGINAFAANGLKSLEFSDGGAMSIGDFSFSFNELTSVKIPHGVTSIGKCAFEMNKLTSVEIPNSVTSIDKWAFVRNKLTSVEIPNSVTSIGDYAFSVNKLTSVKIPDGVTHIGEATFSNNELTSIIIPDNVKNVEYQAFRDNPLTSITLNGGATYGVREVPGYGQPPTKWGVFKYSIDKLIQVTISGENMIGRKIKIVLDPQTYTDIYYKDASPVKDSDIVKVGETVYVKRYKVSFVMDGGISEDQWVVCKIDPSSSTGYSGLATPPSVAEVEGKTFIGWDSDDYLKVTSDLTITAQYAEAPVNYTVTFKDYDGSTLKTQTVLKGSGATAPSSPSRSGYTFSGWDKSFTNVQSNLDIIAQYTKNAPDNGGGSSSGGSSSSQYYTVTFKDHDGKVLGTDRVKRGRDAQAPKEPTREGYIFKRWSNDYSNVKKDLVIIAQYQEKKNSKNYMIGMPDGTFQPEKNLTRAELVTLLDRFYSLENKYKVNASYDKYSDIAKDVWYHDALNRMTQEGLVKGYEDGTFRPEAYVTREELAQIVYNHFDIGCCYRREMNSDFYGNIYKDIYSRWSTDALIGLQVRGLLRDFTEDHFSPTAPISRGETVLLLNRYFGYDSGYDGDYQVTFSDVSADSKWHIPVALASRDKLIKSKFISDLELGLHDK